jgi:hypothetical protein
MDSDQSISLVNSELDEHKKHLTHEELKKAIREVLESEKGKKLKSAEQLAEKVAQKTDTKQVATTTITRLCNNSDFFKKNKQTHFYELVESGVFQQKLTELEGEFNKFTDEKPILCKAVKIYILKTLPHYNVILADKIWEVFKNKPISISTANETDIILYLLKKEESTTEVERETRLNKTKDSGRAVIDELLKFCQRKVEKSKYH